MKNFVFVLVLLFCYSKGYSQEFQIDLSKDPGTERTTSIESLEDFSFKIINRLPGKAYSISVIKENIAIEMLQLQAETTTIMPPAEGATAPCDDFMTLVNSLYDVSSEIDLLSKISIINQAISGLESTLPPDGSSTPEGCTISNIQLASVVLNLTEEEIAQSYSVKQGQKITVTVSRIENGEEKKWVSVFTTGSKGQFQVSYGFSFIFDAFSDERIFFTQQTDDGFIIKKERDSNSPTFVPSLFFTWSGKKSELEDFSLAISGGLGFDLESPTVFLGPTISYNQNLKLNFGIAANKQYSLFGNYNEGQNIAESLTKDQLHEKVYKLNPYISLSFRFNSNPFESNSD